MFIRRVALAALLLTLASAGVVAQKRLVMLCTIAGPTGTAVTSIDASMVTVLENGVPLTVTGAEPVDRTTKLQILIDNGIGMPSTNLSDLRNAVKGLIESLPPGVEVTLVTTAPAPRFVEKGTTSRTRLLDAAARLTFDEHAGKFVDSLREAAERADKDPLETANYTIITVGTTVGDAAVLDRDVNQALQLIQKHQIPVYVVLMQNNNTNTGSTQHDLGTAAAKATGGSIDVINSMNRLITLLPEIGQGLASTLHSGRWFRISADRPAGGPLGKVGVSVKGLTVVDLMLDEARTK